jgi:2'-5' RNA ligase
MERRIFLAFSVDENVKNELKKTLQELIHKNRDIRVNWVEPENFHITIQFLGEIDDNELEKVKVEIEQIATKFKTIQFQLDKIDTFPNVKHPKIIVVKAFEHTRMSNRLQKELTDRLVNKGIQVDLKIWKPHITLGRNKLGIKLNGLENISVSTITWNVEHIEIMESLLSKQGAKYNLIEVYPLTHTV